MISSYDGKLGYGDTSGLATWIMKITVVLMYLTMALYYCKLWNAYKTDNDDHSVVFDADGDGKEDGCAEHCKHCTLLKVLFPAAFSTLLLIVAYIVEPDSVWNAFS